MTGSVLLYVQHLLGIGHLRRSLRIAAALLRERVRVVLVSGGEPFSELEGAAVDRLVQLPPIQALDAGFKVLLDATGRPIDQEVRRSRRTALLSVFDEEEPDALLIE